MKVTIDEIIKTLFFHGRDDVAERIKAHGIAPQPQAVVSKMEIAESQEAVAWSLIFHGNCVNAMTTFDTEKLANDYADKCSIPDQFCPNPKRPVVVPLYTTPPPSQVQALIGEIDEVIFDEYSGGYFHRLDICGAEITDVLDKYRSTK